MTDIKLVRDLMTVGVPTCAVESPVMEIARLMLERNLEALAVLDPEGHAVGVVSQDDLVRAYTRDDCRTLSAEAVMTEGVPEIPPDIPITAAAQIMRDQRVRVMYIMHDSEGISYPAAMLSYAHLLRHLVAEDNADLKDLGIRAERQSPLATFIERRDAARKRAAHPGDTPQ